ncbi:FAD-dependent oxidoreductase [Paenibacillus hodogayensis]|uniref:FAD-dependent oxidoreductase n=1 Tax=Paenibacillus hodogayensis TaxID=279208 RepID=A0ABV5W7X9_9BACL
MTRQAYEVALYGAAPGGVGAAITAARSGRRTVQLDPSVHIAGLMTRALPCSWKRRRFER